MSTAGITAPLMVVRGDGALISAPDFERFYVEKKDCALKSVHCEVVAGMIFVNPDVDKAAAQKAVMAFLSRQKAGQFSQRHFQCIYCEGTRGVCLNVSQV